MTPEALLKLKGHPTVVGVGLLALDVVINSETDRPARLYAGGTCGNVLSILSYFGWKSYPVSRLKTDVASRHVLKDLKRWGVRTDFVRTRPSVDTPMIVERVRTTPAGEASHRFVWTCPHCGAWLPGYRAVHATAAEEVAKRLNTPRVLFLDRISPGALVLAKASAEKGALIVFEPSGMGDPRLFREILALSHILKYSNERLNEMSGLREPTGPLLEIETFGSEGLRYRFHLRSVASRDWEALPAYRLNNVRDTAGSGDWCTAGMLHVLGRQGAAGFKSATPQQLKQALRFGQALAAWNCGFEGARGGMYVVDKEALAADVSRIMDGNQTAPLTTNGAIRKAARLLRCIGPACRRTAKSRRTTTMKK